MMMRLFMVGLLSMAVLLAGCSKSPEDAKKELADKAAASQAAPVENSFGAGTQVDVLRRIARLEAEVFGKNRI